jgi:hypothetical protein
MPKKLTYSQQKKLAMQWKAAAPALRAQRHADIRQRDNSRSIVLLDPFFQEALKQKKPTSTSGLVQMYQILGRAPMDRTVKD